MSALLLSRADIAQLMSPREYLAAVEMGFRASAEGNASVPSPLHLLGAGGGIHVKAARIPGSVSAKGRPAGAFKLNANFPGNPALGLPTIQGAILLFDLCNGRLLAIMDSIEITLRRTAAATALAARALARRDAVTVAICGCGAQAPAQVEALSQVATIAQGYALDTDPAKAAALAKTAMRLTGAPFQPAAAAPNAVTRESDIIVTCTTAQAAFLGVDDVRPGAFIAAVGADNPAKSEIEPALMARARVVVDSLDQCAAMGDLHHAIAAGAMTAGDVHAELAQVIVDARRWRPGASDIVVYDSTGVAHQDAASAMLAYERAIAQGRGAEIELA
jgi:ornithine cyclodeaminase/alanine dehydrogenase-like protein (mu-crystallin family)